MRIRIDGAIPRFLYVFMACIEGFSPFTNQPFHCKSIHGLTKQVTLLIRGVPSCVLLTNIQSRRMQNIHPGTGHRGPERECRFGSTLSLTSALDGGETCSDLVPIV